MCITKVVDAAPVTASHRLSCTPPHPSTMLQPSTSPDTSSAAKIPLFQSSTQYKNWRLSVEQLKATRTALNQGAVAAIRNTFESDSVCTCRTLRFVLTAIETNPFMCSPVRRLTSISLTPMRSIFSSSCTSPKYLNYAATFASRRKSRPPESPT